MKKLFNTWLNKQVLFIQEAKQKKCCGSGNGAKKIRVGRLGKVFFVNQFYTIYQISASSRACLSGYVSKNDGMYYHTKVTSAAGV